MNNIETIEKADMWPSPVHHYRAIDLESERLYLIEEFYKVEKENHRPSNSPCQNGIIIQESTIPELVSVKEKLIDPINRDFWSKFTHGYNNVPDISELSYKSWFVEYEPGMYMPYHLHADSVFTAIWYISMEDKIPGSGDLILHNPIIASSLIGFYRPFKNIEPETNSVIVAPSWLGHHVSPASGKRILLVWDILRTKDTTWVKYV